MMWPMLLSELEVPLEAQLVGADQTLSGVSTDSRALRSGDLFVALRGEHFNGHGYLRQAQEAGAVAALVSETVETSLSLLQVKDTQRALGRLGAHNRGLFAGSLVAVTGSSGKTTVKNLIHAVLSRRGETLATEGNFNNEIGVPLTLLRLDANSRFAVVEMGAAAAGDIAWLCELGRPRIALLLNAMPAHLQGFGSVEDVAAAKGEIFDGLGRGGVAIINADQPWAAAWRERAGEATVIDFGLEQPAAVTAREIESRGLSGSRFIAVTPAGELPVQLQLPGRHNVGNALAAVCAGLACELSLAEIGAGLASVSPVAGRLSTIAAPGGVTVIDDCYNANPGSMRAAIDLLAQCAPRRTAVLGAMRELGPTSEALHRDVGDYARQVGIERFWGVGDELLPAVDAFGAGACHFSDYEALLPALAGEFGEGDTVLVKGSRGAAMERVVQALSGDDVTGAG